MRATWTPLLALVLTLLPLLWARRWLDRHLQELSHRWTGDPDVAIYFYFVLVLPGVLLHEVCHWLMASALGVRVGRLSLGPVRRARGRQVSLGSVQVARADPVRSSLIGMAPLLGASAVILLIGNRVLGIDDLARALGGQGSEGLWAGLGQLARVPDFGVWLYLIFALSNAMLPSESDMAPVRPVLIFLGAVTLLVVVFGSAPASISSLVTRAAGYLASAFGLTLAVDALWMALLALLLLVTRRLQDR